MPIKKIVTFLLVFLSIGLAVASWLQAGWFNDSDNKTSTFWPSWNMAEVTCISITDSLASFSLITQNGEWFVAPGIVKPEQERRSNTDSFFRADPAQVESFLSFISKSAPNMEGEEELDRQMLKSLERPEITLTIKGAQEWMLSIGGLNKGKKSVAAICSGAERPFSLNQAFNSVLSRRMEYYQDLRLMPLASRDINKVRLNGPDGLLWEINRTVSGFAFTAPENLRSLPVDDSEMEYYLHALSTMKVSSLMPESSEEALRRDMRYLDDAPYVILILGADDVPYTVNLYRDSPDAATRLGYSSWHKAFFIMAAQRWEALVPSDQSLCRRQIIDLVDLSSVRGQRIITKRGAKEQSWNFRRSADGWVDEATGQESSGLDLLLWRLGNLKYEGMPLDHPPKDMEMELEWELTRERGQPIFLRFYTASGAGKGLCLISVAGDQWHYFVSNRLLMDLEGLLPGSAGHLNSVN